MKRFLAQLRAMLMECATPYCNNNGVSHLYHADGTPYMYRWQLFSIGQFNLRLHDIVTKDVDRHLHDHPWNFLSLVLTGGYLELRPVRRSPCFEGETEKCTVTYRTSGSLAFRRATDRHRIAKVEADTTTLILTWPRVQWWGFYTPAGKVYWKDYPSVHGAAEDTQ